MAMQKKKAVGKRKKVRGKETHITFPAQIAAVIEKSRTKHRRGVQAQVLLFVERGIAASSDL